MMPSLAEYQTALQHAAQAKDWEKAADITARMRHEYPTDPSGFLSGSFIALMSDAKTQALELVDTWLKSHPDDIACRIQRAECLWGINQTEAAIRECLAVAESASQDAAALAACADFLTFAKESSQALRMYDDVVKLMPTDAMHWTKRGLLHRELGQFEQALADFNEAARLDPHNGDVIRFKTELKATTVDEHSIQEIEAALAAQVSNPEQTVALRFALAEAYMKLGDTKAAWRHWMLGNRTERSRLQYQPELDRRIVDLLIENFPDQASALQAANSETEVSQPIFIVGLPRTGTTLMERIIGAHSLVRMAGEIPSFQDALGALVQAQNPSEPMSLDRFFSGISELNGSAIAREYLDRSKPWRHDANCFTDKSLLNFLFVPLIFRAFPRAKIVHVRRHPMAAAFAIFRTWFRGNFPFSYDLNEIAEFMVGYRRLMTHWQGVFDARLLTIDYESLVTDQEAVIREILKYIGLPFEEQCLNFHQQADLVRTASYQQVRQPIYESSLEAWRIFEAELAPVWNRLSSAQLL